MSNINNAIALLPESASPFVKAKYQGETVKYESITDIIKIMQLGMNLLGHYDQAGNSSVLKIVAENTIKMILSNYKPLTIQELQLAIEKGCRGEYELKKGSLRVLNVENINFWIKSLYADETRKIAINYYHTLLNAPKAVPTPEEKDLIFKNACLAAYEDFKKDGTMPLTYRVIYDYLKTALKIEWTETERAEIKKVAKENYERELKIKKIGGELTKIQFESALENKKSLDNEMKKVALLYYFRKVKNSKQEIKF